MGGMVRVLHSVVCPIPWYYDNPRHKKMSEKHVFIYLVYSNDIF